MIYRSELTFSQMHLQIIENWSIVFLNMHKLLFFLSFVGKLFHKKLALILTYLCIANRSRGRLFQTERISYGLVIVLVRRTVS